MEIILASSSPRRKKILSDLNLDFKVIEPRCEEIVNKNKPQDIVMDISRQKFDAVYNDIKYDISEDTALIAADTNVVFQDSIFGKPKNKQDAFSMLSKMNNNWHTVYTGVTFSMLSSNIQNDIVTYCVSSDVHMIKLSDKEIWDYIETGLPMDKAGAYGVQDKDGYYIDKIKGEYENVVGLPIEKLKVLMGV